MKIVIAPDKFKGSADRGGGAAELAVARIAAVYPLSDLEPDPERCRAEAGPLLRRAGQMIARERLAEAGPRHDGDQAGNRAEAGP